MNASIDKSSDLANEAKRYEHPIASRSFIMELLENALKPLRRKEIADQLGIHDAKQQEALRRRLRAMERDGELVFTKNKCYLVAKRLSMVKGIVIGHPAGYGFLQVANQIDRFLLEESALQRCIDGDLILAQCTGECRQGKEIARFIRILQPRNSTIVGTFFLEEGLCYVVPCNKRLPFDVLIPQGKTPQAQPGELVSVELLQRREGKLHAESQLAIREFQLPHQWNAALLDELPEAELATTATEQRRDLLHLPFVTIDNEDSRDFDDAVFAQTSPSKGWTLWAAIADVAHYVPAGSALDQEAYKRGTSVYFPNSVIPMLPERLSNELCSLKPNERRLALVCEMRISANGLLSHYKFYEATIRSRARLTYEEVSTWLLRDQPPSSLSVECWKSLKDLHAVYQKLAKQREQRGAISFDEPEARFQFDEQGKISQIQTTMRNDAHKLIEECMLLANRSAAQFLQTHKLLAPYRVHLAPKESSFQSLCRQLQELGLTLPASKRLSTKFYHTLLKNIEGRNDESLLRSMVLKSMQSAYYSSENQAHFGLGVAQYAHFTSPIRRYPDLLVHRAIKAHIGSPKEHRSPTPEEQEVLREQVAHCSFTERRADEAAATALEHLKCHYLQIFIGKTFLGTIVSVVPFGVFVRMEESGIVGLVHLSSFSNAYYRYEIQTQQMVSEATGVTYKLGDRVSVKLKNIEVHSRSIELQLVKPKRRSPPSRSRHKQRAPKPSVTTNL